MSKWKLYLMTFLLFLFCTLALSVAFRSTARADPAVIFSDGFESGDGSAWNGGSVIRGGTQSFVNSPVYQGNWAMECQITSPGTSWVVVWAQWSGHPTLYFRAYVQFTTLPANAGQDTVMVELETSDTYCLAALGLGYSGGAPKWMLYYMKNGANSYSTLYAGTPTPITNEWHCLELMGTVDASNGAVKGYIDGQLILSDSGFENDYHGQAHLTTLGLDTWTAQDYINTGYFDCAVVSDAYIGPIVQVTFDQTGLSSGFTGTVLTVDGFNYTLTQMPVSFWWYFNSSHAFAYQSPLIISPDEKQYAWSSTSGTLGETIQSGSIVAGSSGTVVGNYVTQYYLTVKTNPVDINDPTGDGWYNSGFSVPISTSQDVDIVSGFSRYNFTGWTGDSEIADPTLASTTVLMDAAKTVTANYLTQYHLTVSTNSGTINPVSGWYDAGSVLTIQATAPTVVTAERYVWNGWAGTGTGSYTGTDNPATNEVTMNNPVSEVASWTHQYYLTVASVYGIPTGDGWYDSGSTAYASLKEGNVPGGADTRYVFTGWGHDASGFGLTSNAITMDGPKLAYANWQTQYLVTYSATGNVLPVTVPSDEWVRSGGSAISVFPAQVTVGGTRCNFVSDNRTLITGPSLIIGTYANQYLLTVNSTYGTPGGGGWYNNSSTAYATLTDGTVSGGAGTRYVFTGWGTDASGTNYTQSDAITMDGPKTATASWQTQYNVTFASSGVGSDFSGAVVTVNGTDYDGNGASFWANSGDVYNFSFNSTLVVRANENRYVWNSTSGDLDQTLQNDTITVAAPGTVVGNYDTQYYLTLTSNPTGAGTQTGVGWYDAGSSAPISTDQYLTIVPLSSRYSFTYWTTADVIKISDSTATSTTVLMDEAETVTANYVIQYNVSFAQSGLKGTATGTVVTVNGSAILYTSLPYSLWVNSGDSVLFGYANVSSTVSSEQFMLTGVNDTSPLMVTGPVTVTGTYTDTVPEFPEVSMIIVLLSLLSLSAAATSMIRKRNRVRVSDRSTMPESSHA